MEADGKEYKVKDATIIKLGEPYTMTEDTLNLTITFEPLPVTSIWHARSIFPPSTQLPYLQTH